MGYCDGLFSLSMFSRFICVIICISTSFLFITRYYSILQIRIVFIHLIFGHLYFFYFLSIKNNAAININVQVFMLTYAFSWVQAYLKGVADSVPDHHNKVNITIKQITKFFGFPVHIKVIFILYCSEVSNFWHLWATLEEEELSWATQ